MRPRLRMLCCAGHMFGCISCRCIVMFHLPFVAWGHRQKLHADYQWKLLDLYLKQETTWLKELAWHCMENKNEARKYFPTLQFLRKTVLYRRYWTVLSEWLTKHITTRFCRMPNCYAAWMDENHIKWLEDSMFDMTDHFDDLQTIFLLLQNVV